MFQSTECCSECLCRWWMVIGDLVDGEIGQYFYLYIIGASQTFLLTSILHHTLDLQRPISRSFESKTNCKCLLPPPSQKSNRQHGTHSSPPPCHPPTGSLARKSTISLLGPLHLPQERTFSLLICAEMTIKYVQVPSSTHLHPFFYTIFAHTAGRGACIGHVHVSYLYIHSNLPKPHRVEQ